jgi:hypothetical protein
VVLRTASRRSQIIPAVVVRNALRRGLVLVLVLPLLSYFKSFRRRQNNAVHNHGNLPSAASLFPPEDFHRLPNTLRAPNRLAGAPSQATACSPTMLALV